MRSNIPAKWLFLTGGAVILTFSAIVVSLPDNIAVVSVKSIILLGQPIPGLPVRLKIPVINVDALVEHVGVAPDGTMAVPKGPADTSWFALGTPPGAIGSAVIAGHYGWKNGIPAAFDNLSTLHPGDKLYIEDDRGATVTFVVRKVQIYEKDADASTVFLSSDGKAHLNLVTCEGVWNKSQQSYAGRLVVFTDRETPSP